MCPFMSFKKYWRMSTTLLRKRELARIREIREARKIQTKADTFKELKDFENRNLDVLYGHNIKNFEDSDDAFLDEAALQNPDMLAAAAKILKESLEATELADVFGAKLVPPPIEPARTTLEGIIDDIRYNAKIKAMMQDDRVKAFRKQSQRDFFSFNPQERTEFLEKLHRTFRSTITLPVEALPPPKVKQMTVAPLRRQVSHATTIDPHFVLPKQVANPMPKLIQRTDIRTGRYVRTANGEPNHRFGESRSSLQRMQTLDTLYNRFTMRDNTRIDRLRKEKTMQRSAEARNRMLMARTRLPTISQNEKGHIQPRDILRLNTAVDSMNARGSLIKGYEYLFE